MCLCAAHVCMCVCTRVYAVERRGLAGDLARQRHAQVQEQGGQRQAGVGGHGGQGAPRRKEDWRKDDCKRSPEERRRFCSPLQGRRVLALSAAEASTHVLWRDKQSRVRQQAKQRAPTARGRETGPVGVLGPNVEIVLPPAFRRLLPSRHRVLHVRTRGSTWQYMCIGARASGHMGCPHKH